ncbi:MAG: MarR family winged helix-turn-helix transcriptional regulator [Rhodocyclaceae bacterium]|jgi:DNA-binding MarR family transcriptional regulator|nr:MarR family winged helix-turn-helix transcriptional regulator [Rhodocyclaceae bacterium]
MRDNTSPAEPHAQPLQQAILAVRRLFHALAGFGQAAPGVTASQRAVLDVLHGRGPRTVPQVAREQGVSRQHVQMLVNGLLGAGLVECIDNPDHLRSPLLRLSAAGLKAVETARRREQRQLAELAQRIPGTDLKVTLKTLNAMESGLSRRESRAGSRA